MTLNTKQRELLRRLTLNDETALSVVMSGKTPGWKTLLDDQTRALVRLAGLVALECENATFQVAWDTAWAAGVSDEEILETIIAVAPLVGTTRIASALSRVEAALDNG
jgi:alkylhydroperoxidase/carboxymuconolactone decarboxylase family protein YurZ